MGNSKISVDLNQRTFAIEVPDENVGQVLEQLGQLFGRHPPAQVNSAAPELAIEDRDPGEADARPSEGEDDKATRKRRSGKGGAKVRAYELVDLGLSQDQRVEMQSFFREKSPKGQNDQVAVLAVKLKEYKGKSDFTADEIHSAFKVVNRPTPKNLAAVLGNMKRDGKAGYTENKLIVNSFTEDHVAFHMDSKNEKSGK